MSNLKRKLKVAAAYMGTSWM